MNSAKQSKLEGLRNVIQFINKLTSAFAYFRGENSHLDALLDNIKLILKVQNCLFDSEERNDTAHASTREQSGYPERKPPEEEINVLQTALHEIKLQLPAFRFSASNSANSATLQLFLQNLQKAIKKHSQLSCNLDQSSRKRASSTRELSVELVELGSDSNSSSSTSPGPDVSETSISCEVDAELIGPEENIDRAENSVSTDPVSSNTHAAIASNPKNNRSSVQSHTNIKKRKIVQLKHRKKTTTLVQPFIPVNVRLTKVKIETDFNSMAKMELVNDEDRSSASTANVRTVINEMLSPGSVPVSSRHVQSIAAVHPIWSDQTVSQPIASTSTENPLEVEDIQNQNQIEEADALAGTDEDSHTEECWADAPHPVVPNGTNDTRDTDQSLDQQDLSNQVRSRAHCSRDIHGGPQTQNQDDSEKLQGAKVLCTSLLMKGPRKVFHAAAVIGDNIYSVGGYSASKSVKGAIDVYVLNTTTPSSKWNALSFISNASTPPKLNNHSVVAHDHFIYLWGGIWDQRIYNTLYCFDTRFLKWEKPLVSGATPSARGGHAAVVIGNHMYIIGGCKVGEVRSAEIYALNLETLFWSLITTGGLPLTPRTNFSATVHQGKYVLVFGGINEAKDGKIQCCNNLACFDVEKLEWLYPVTSGVPPQIRQGHTAFMLNGWMYIFGGHEFVSKTYYDDLFRYNPAVLKWEKVNFDGHNPVSRCGAACAVVKDDQAIIFGGSVVKKCYMDTFSFALSP